MADADYRAWVEVLPDFKNFNQTVENAVVGGMAGAGTSGSSAMGGALVAGVGKWAGPIAVALGALAIGTAIADQVKQGIDAGIAYARQAVAHAADLEQSVGAVDAVFKDQARQIKIWGEVSAETVGLSKNNYFEFATVVGAQLKNLGLPMEDVADQTNELIELGADLAAQYGGPTSDAVAALSSLLRGERDPIERYGVSMKEVDVTAEKLAMGLSGLTGEQDKQATILATLEILNRQTADAQGAFARESGTLLNEQQKLQAILENVSAEFGEAFLPVISDVMVFVRDNLIPIWRDMNEVMGPALAAALEVIWEPLQNLWDELSRLFEVLLPEGVSILGLLAASIIAVGLWLALGIDIIAAYAQSWADFFAFLRGDMTFDVLVKRTGERMAQIGENFNTRMEAAKESMRGINDIIASLGEEAYEGGVQIGYRLGDGLAASRPYAENSMIQTMNRINAYLPKSPAKLGPFSGSGWTDLKKSGRAIIDQVMSGMDHFDVPLTASISGTTVRPTGSLLQPAGEPAVSAPVGGDSAMRLDDSSIEKLARVLSGYLRNQERGAA